MAAATRGELLHVLTRRSSAQGAGPGGEDGVARRGPAAGELILPALRTSELDSSKFAGRGLAHFRASETEALEGPKVDPTYPRGIIGPLSY